MPTILTVDPVASSQIDITWSTSTDNFFLAGYVLYRDDAVLATTTLNSFSDTGLTPSTTYAYYVQAFDSSLNYSATSTTATATTPAVPVAPIATSSSSGGGTFVGAELDTFSVAPSITDADFTLTTERPVRIELRWGRTGSYELGYVTSDIFNTSFQTTISDLEPGTTYEYQIIGYSVRNIPTELRSGQFTTLFREFAIPSNVRNLQALVEGINVDLSWQLPSDNVSYVRIVRSYLGYPISPTDGAIVYQGTGESFTDDSILAQFSPVYYTVFTYGLDGAVSSGAVAVAVREVASTDPVLPPTAPTEPPVTSEDGVETFIEEATTTDQVTDPSAVRIPSREEVFVRTQDQQYTLASPRIEIAKGSPFTVSVPKSAVSQNLKTLLISFTDPANAEQSYSYILRLNREGTAYEATMDPFFVTGWSEFSLFLYDFEARVTARYFKRVWFGTTERGNEEVWFPDLFFKQPLVLGGAIAGLLLLLALLLLFATRRK